MAEDLIKHKDGTAGGYLVGRKHTDGGIKAINKDNDQPIEMESEEVVITADAVKDATKHSYKGQLMTNREILSDINVSGGGVSFDAGGEVATWKLTGATYQFGGEMRSDRDIYKVMTNRPTDEWVKYFLPLRSVIVLGSDKDGNRVEKEFDSWVGANDFVRTMCEATPSKETPQTWTFSMRWDREGGTINGYTVDLRSPMDLHSRNIALDPTHFDNFIAAFHAIHTLVGIATEADPSGFHQLIQLQLDLSEKDASRALQLLSTISNESDNYIWRGHPRLTVKDIVANYLLTVLHKGNQQCSLGYKFFGTNHPERIEKAIDAQEDFLAAGGTIGYDEQYAHTILDQLGGNHFIAMTGAKQFVMDPKKKMIAFRIGRNNTRANYVRIYLNAMDTYDVEFLYVSTKEFKVLQRYDGIYNDQLQDIFTIYTGLFTHLAKGGRLRTDDLRRLPDDVKDILTWGDIPDTFKYVQNIRPITLEPEMDNKDFVNLMKPFTSSDDLRLLDEFEISLSQEEMDSLKYAKGGTIKSKVEAAEDELKEMKTHGELRQWAIANGMDNRSAFPRFKKSLLDIGIDYNAIRSGIKKEKRKALEQAVNYETTLYVDAKASADRFAITDEDGNVLWYGRFFDNDRDYDGEQSSAELAAAKKAVWFAGKIKETLNEDAIRLNLYVDAQWLLYQDHPGQKGFVLTQLANRYNVQLNLEWIPGKDNPADEWTTASGYQKWSENDLSALAQPVSGDAPPKKEPIQYARDLLQSGQAEIPINLRKPGETPIGDRSVFTDSTYRGAAPYAVAVGTDGLISASVSMGAISGLSDLDKDTIKELVTEKLTPHGVVVFGEGSGTQFFANDREGLSAFKNYDIYKVPDIRMSERFGKKMTVTNYHALPPAKQVTDTPELDQEFDELDKLINF